MVSPHGRAPITALVLLVVLALAAPVAATSSGDHRSQRERARERQAEVARQIDTLRADDQQLARAVEELDRLIASQAAQVEAARQALAAAEEEVAETQRHLDTTRGRISDLRATLIERAVESYIRPGGDQLEQLVNAQDFGEASRRQVLLQQVAATDQELIDELNAAVEDLEVAEAEALAATERARERREAQEARLSELRASRAQQTEAKAELSRRITAFQREADELAREENRLTRLILDAERSRRGQLVGPGSVSAAGLIWPVRGVVTSEYGQRWGRLHAGIDISAPSGTPIVAAQSGVVIQSGWMGGYGNTVVIDHGGGFTTVYAHQSRVAARDGQRVSRGDVIGYIGSTGYSTGPHLHFETRVNGSPQNPRRYLP